MTDLEKGTIINASAFIPNISEENKYIFRLSKTVRMLAILDFFFGIFMFLFGYIGFYIPIRLVFSICGYYGSKNYNYSLTFIYAIYLFFGTITELLLIFLYQNLYLEDKIGREILIIGSIYQFILFMLKAYITRFVCIFISKINKLTEISKSDLLIYESQPVKIIYWT